MMITVTVAVFCNSLQQRQSGGCKNGLHFISAVAQAASEPAQ
jgi:hypothetical protein